jgi:hypothetical protein
MISFLLQPLFQQKIREVEAAYTVNGIGPALVQGNHIFGEIIR